MDKQNSVPDSKTLFVELLKVLHDFGTLEIKLYQFAEELASAENLKLEDKLMNAQMQMMFLKQKAFYLQLRYIRTLHMLMQKNRNFMYN